MNTYITSQNWIGNDTQSTKRGHVKRRLAKLHSEALCEKAAASHRKHLNKKKQEKVLAKIGWRTRSKNAQVGLESRVRFHLSRGRDAADIAIRENVLVSTVQAIIGKASTPPPPPPVRNLFPE